MRNEWERFFTTGRLEDYLTAKSVEESDIFQNSQQDLDEIKKSSDKLNNRQNITDTKSFDLKSRWQ